jgi:hypothetical protein
MEGRAKSRTMYAHLYGKGPIDIHILLLGTLLYASATSLWHVLASQVSRTIDGHPYGRESVEGLEKQSRGPCMHIYMERDP